MKKCFMILTWMLCSTGVLYAWNAEDEVSAQYAEIVTNFVNAFNERKIEKVRNYFLPTSAIRVLRPGTHETMLIERDGFIKGFLSMWEESRFSVSEMDILGDTIILRVNRYWQGNPLPRESRDGIDYWRFNQENPPKIIFMDIVPDEEAIMSEPLSVPD